MRQSRANVRPTDAAKSERVSGRYGALPHGQHNAVSLSGGTENITDTANTTND